MRTIRHLIDNDNKVWIEGDFVKLTFTGARAGKEYFGEIKVIGVNMMTVDFHEENGKTHEEQLMDIHTIKTIERWEKNE